MEFRNSSPDGMAPEAPLFLIGVPTHNRPSTFASAVLSVARQKLRDFELIVVDDNSMTDYATVRCDEFNFPFPYQLVRNQCQWNLAGGTANRNGGVQAKRRKYIISLSWTTTNPRKPSLKSFPLFSYV